MTDLYMKKLKKACDKLENKDKNANFLSLIMPIINAYNDIKINVFDDTIINNSLLQIKNIKKNNPDLKGVVDAILDIVINPDKMEIKL